MKPWRGLESGTIDGSVADLAVPSTVVLNDLELDDSVDCRHCPAVVVDAGLDANDVAGLGIESPFQIRVRGRIDLSMAKEQATHLLA